MLMQVHIVRQGGRTGLMKARVAGTSGVPIRCAYMVCLYVIARALISIHSLNSYRHVSLSLTLKK